MSNETSENPSKLLDVEDVRLLRRALAEWGGPGHASSALAVAMGFADVPDLLARCLELASDLKNDVPIPSADWARIMSASEIVFVSDIFGSGVDWQTTTGMLDIDTIERLRSIQAKLGSILRPHYGGMF